MTTLARSKTPKHWTQTNPSLSTKISLATLSLTQSDALAYSALAYSADLTWIVSQCPACITWYWQSTGPSNNKDKQRHMGATILTQILSTHTAIKDKPWAHSYKPWHITTNLPRNLLTTRKTIWINLNDLLNGSTQTLTTHTAIRTTMSPLA